MGRLGCVSRETHNLPAPFGGPLKAGPQDSDALLKKGVELAFMEEEIKQEEAQEETKQETQDQGEKKPLEKMTATELREVALEIPGITGVHAMKKEELLATIKEARGIVDEQPAKKAKKKVKTGISVKDLKGMIARLKVEKEASLESKDRKKRDVLRRRINRLKKRTRKVA